MDIELLEKHENGEEVRFAFRTICAIIFGILLTAFIIASRVSEMTSYVRLLFVSAMIFGLFTGAVYLVKFFINQPRSLYPVIFLLVFFFVWTIIGSRTPNTYNLRTAYLRRLASFEGTKFVWGGESHQGIDCSGLARTALWQAMVKEGFKEMNPRLLGSTLWDFWWHDVGAKDIGLGKYGYTRVIGYVPKLAGYDTSDLNEGDLAVADSGHVLIYFSEGRWIEANPGDGKVVINSAPADSKRGYFNTPVTLVRWQILDTDTDAGR